MKRCLSLAAKGMGKVSPNPMVGCVVVHKGKVIAEGYHKKYGAPHAEINALNTIKDKEILKKSTLYVSLEPCSHHGKTPPCADAIVKYGIKRVVIGCVDPNPNVKGKGIAKLVKGGCDVIIGVLEKECIELNKRFFTFQLNKRPYIILKWAMTKDGFIDKVRNPTEKPLKITGAQANKLSHTWRSEEQAIMIGTNTAILDNPTLTTRNIKGRSPIRVILDRNLRIPVNSNIFNNFASVIVLNSKKNLTRGNVDFVKIKFEKNLLNALLTELYKRNIQSVIVEGGAKLLDSFIAQGLWDECRIFIGTKKISDGVKAPVIKDMGANKIKVGNDTLYQFIKGNK